MTARVLVFCLLSAAQFRGQPVSLPKIGIIDYFGLKKANRERIEKALEVKKGGPLPKSKSEIEEQIELVKGQMEKMATGVERSEVFQECGHSLALEAPDGTVLEEADESAYWMELLIESGKAAHERADALLCEANELVAISVSSINTARKGQ